jgi:polar amino acid transport system permease protein
MEAFREFTAYLPALLEGSVLTISLTAAAVSIGFFLSVFLALGKISHYRFISAPCSFYIWFFRGTPLMMQLFFVYYALPLINPALNISNKFVAALIAFALNSGAYLAEIVRAAIQSIDKGQLEASRALGMTYGQAMRRIIIPQSYRRLIPPLSNEFIMVLKDTALVSAIALTDLMRTTNLIQTRTGSALVYVPAMLLYLIMTTLFTFIAGKLEKRFAVYD